MHKALIILGTAVIIVGSFGCAQGMRVVDYHGPQDWPTGRASTTGTEIYDTPIVYGLPGRPYDVVQFVEIPHRDRLDDATLAAAARQLQRTQPDALVLIGTRYDRMLEVDKFLAASKADQNCMRTIAHVRSKNARGGKQPLTLLAVRWKELRPVFRGATSWRP